jgi:hypothetical protein
VSPTTTVVTSGMHLVTVTDLCSGYGIAVTEEGSPVTFHLSKQIGDSRGVEIGDTIGSWNLRPSLVKGDPPWLGLWQVV